MGYIAITGIDFPLRTDKQLHTQSLLPLTLIPIRIDLEIGSYIPHPALPLPADAHAYGINPALPAYRQPEQTPPYRFKDFFTWNLHETLITPEQFAQTLVNELDLPTPQLLALQIASQIRQQLEEYAGVALHPLFHSTNATNSNGTVTRVIHANGSRDQSQTPAAPATPAPNGVNGSLIPSKPGSITAIATPTAFTQSDVDNPDDTYRCIINLNINLLNRLYSDKFEWSLLHPPGMAEIFAKQTCADLGLAGEWVPAIAHGIYEAVLRLKKEACESGGLVGGTEIDNLTLEGREAGWRYDNEHLADEWEPRIETLTKEEIEKREGDREREIRRLRRDANRFTSNTNMIAGVPTTSYFDQPDGADTPMGRGERSKKKRRFRSLSPTGRGGTPGGSSEAAGYGGVGGGPNEWYAMYLVLNS